MTPYHILKYLYIFIPFHIYEENNLLKNVHMNQLSLNDSKDFEFMRFFVVLKFHVLGLFLHFIFIKH